MAEMMEASADQDSFKALQEGAETIVYLGRGAHILGAVSIADKVRDTSASALAALRESGVGRISMMTGCAGAVREGGHEGLRADFNKVGGPSWAK